MVWLQLLKMLAAAAAAAAVVAVVAVVGPQPPTPLPPQKMAVPSRRKTARHHRRWGPVVVPVEAVLVFPIQLVADPTGLAVLWEKVWLLPMRVVIPGPNQRPVE
jgi:hypothetical protein